MASLLSWVGNTASNVEHAVTHNPVTNFVGHNIVQPTAKVVPQFAVDASNQIYNRAVAPVLHTPNFTPTQVAPISGLARGVGATGSLHQTLGSGLQTGLLLGSGGLYGAGEKVASRALPPVLARAASSGALGAGYNAASAATAGARPNQILKSAAVGGALGAAIPLGAEGIKVGAKGTAAAYNARTPLNEVGGIKTPSLPPKTPPEKISTPVVGKAKAGQGSGKQTRFTGVTIPKSTEVSAPVRKAVGTTYTPGTNAEKLATSAELTSGKLDQATEKVNTTLNQKLGSINGQDVSDAIAVAKAHDAAGNTDTATQIYNKLSQHLTASGQTVQAASLLARRTPEGLRNSAVKTIESGGKAKVTPELQGQIDSTYKAIKAAPEGSNERAFAVQDLQKIVNNNVTHSKLDQAFTLWRTGLLTGSLTATKVGLSHTLLNTAEKIKDVPAVALDKVIAPFSGVRSTALTGRGVGSGALQGAKAFGTLLRTGHDTPGTSGLGGTYEELATPRTAYGNSVGGKVANFYTSKVGQVHAGIPKAFYRSAYENDLYKQGIAQGLKGQDLTDFVTKPPAEADAGAHLAAQKATFQQPTFLGRAASEAQRVPGGRVLIPFARIASAILTDVKDYSPIGAMQSVFDAAKASKTGWTPAIQKQLVEGIGRGVTGTGVVALGAQLFKKGDITTSYPTTPKERALWSAEGKQENSILINGKWEKTDALGPFGSLLAAGALYGSSKGNNAKGQSNVTQALTGALTDISGQSYLSGITQGAAAVQNPTENLKSFAKLEAGSVIPVGVGQVAAAGDKDIRTASSPLDSIKSKIPGLRETLPVAQTPFGQPVLNGNPGIGGVTNPLRPTKAISEPVTNELQRLTNNLGTTPVPVPLPVTKLSGTVNGATKSIPLSKAQQSQFTAAAGPQIHQALSTVINTPGYQTLDDNSKAAALTNAKTLAENQAKTQAFNQISSNPKAPLQNISTTVSTNTVASAAVQKAQIAADKAAFSTSGSNFQTIDGTVFAKDAAGNVTSTPETTYQYDLGTATLTQQKDAGDLSGYIATAQNQLQLIQKQLSDPTIAVNPLQVTKLQNDASTLQTNIAKYSSYGGFTSSSSGSSTKIPNFKIAASKLKAPKVGKISANKGSSFKAPKLAKGSSGKVSKIAIKSSKQKTPKLGVAAIPKVPKTVA